MAARSDLKHFALYKGRERPTVVTKARKIASCVQKANRSALLSSRRVVFSGSCKEVEEQGGESRQLDTTSSNQPAELLCDFKAQAVEMCKSLSKAANRDSCLRKLVLLSANSEGFSEEFSKNGTALFQLGGILSGHIPLHQALAAQCATNLASAGPWSSKLLTPLGSYLVSNLSSPLPILKDYSAWAIGNMAGESPKCRRVLVSQGAVPPLCRVVQAGGEDPSLLYSALFALRNLTHWQEGFVLDSVLKANLLQSLLLVLLEQTEGGRGGEGCGLSVLSEALWVLSHLVVSREVVLTMSKTQLLVAVCELLCAAHLGIQQELVVVTVCLRILGNSVGHLPDLVTTLPSGGPVERRLLECSCHVTVGHLKKEADWVLSNIKCAQDIILGSREGAV